jgi:hypothetical protein
MIRDPSDGSVKEKRPDDKQDVISSGPVIDANTSGLPITKAKANYLERLAKSHEWLTDYLKSKEGTDAK